MRENRYQLLKKKEIKKKVSVLGIPFDLGKDNMGTDEGPKSLREARLTSVLADLGCEVKDLGDVACPSRETSVMGDRRAKYLAANVAVANEVAKITNEQVKDKRVMICLGGDHAISVGTIAGAAVACAGDMGVVYIDAHADAMTSANTLSGNIHGMDTAALMGYGEEVLVNILQKGAKVKKENFVFIGLKDLDRAEADFIEQEKIVAVTIYDLLAEGLKIAEDAIDALQKRVKNIWVSLDLDAIDQKYAPGVFIQNFGGLNYREVNALTKYIGSSCQVAGLDVVELAPRLDVNNKTAMLGVEMVANLLGGEHNWYTEYMRHEQKKQKNRG